MQYGNMDTCPIEVIHLIFAFVIPNDGGSAVCSLRLVSCAFLALTAPFQFQSVTVSGFEHLSRLLIKLEFSSSKNRRVCNLFFCDRPSEQAVEDFGYPVGEGILFHDEETERYERQKETDELEAMAMAPLVERLLELVAPTIITLTCLVYNPCFNTIPAALAGMPLPMLTHLTYKPAATMHGPFPTEGKDYPVSQRLENACAKENKWTLTCIDKQARQV
jgi:hypothetical protein